MDHLLAVLSIPGGKRYAAASLGTYSKIDPVAIGRLK
jgi:hypothetical protein